MTLKKQPLSLLLFKNHYLQMIKKLICEKLTICEVKLMDST